MNSYHRLISWIKGIVKSSGKTKKALVFTDDDIISILGLENKSFLLFKVIFFIGFTGEFYFFKLFFLNYF
jgi:hypothetical protein